jgi:hypothetical protein
VLNLSSRSVHLGDQFFYWYRMYEELGFSSLEDFLVGFWERFF